MRTHVRNQYAQELVPVAEQVLSASEKLRRYWFS
jgi:hypothetical protein